MSCGCEGVSSLGVATGVWTHGGGGLWAVAGPSETRGPAGGVDEIGGNPPTLSFQVFKGRAHVISRGTRTRGPGWTPPDLSGSVGSEETWTPFLRRRGSCLLDRLFEFRTLAGDGGRFKTYGHPRPKGTTEVVSPEEMRWRRETGKRRGPGSQRLLPLLMQFR